MTTAESDLRRQRQDLADARVKLDRRKRYGRKMWENKREPKVVMGERKRQAQVAAGKRNLHLDRVRQAQQRLTAAEGAVRDDDEVRIDLPATAVHSRQAVLALEEVRLRSGPVVTLDLHGPERVALTGPNGAGKTTLLRTITGELPPGSGQVRLAVPARLLPQRLDILDGALSVADNVARFAPHASPNAIRAGLARLLFPGGAPASRQRPCPEASCSAPPSPPCCSPSPHPSCSCSTSPPTTSTCQAPGTSPRPCAATAVPCWWPATTSRSCGHSGPLGGCASTRNSAKPVHPEPSRPGNHLAVRLDRRWPDAMLNG